MPVYFAPNIDFKTGGFSASLSSFFRALENRIEASVLKILHRAGANELLTKDLQFSATKILHHEGAIDLLAKDLQYSATKILHHEGAIDLLAKDLQFSAAV